MNRKLKISGKFLPDILYGYYYQRKKFLINVLVRAGEGNADEVHIDTDEANACNLDSGMMVEIITK
jgi:propanediol utilization protein